MNHADYLALPDRKRATIAVVLLYWLGYDLKAMRARELTPDESARLTWDDMLC